MSEVTDEGKDETRGTSAGLLNDRMTPSVRRMQAAARGSRREKLGCGGITVSWYGGGVSHSSAACRRLLSYCDNERKVAARRIGLGS